jgi:hypothetical protein
VVLIQWLLTVLLGFAALIQILRQYSYHQAHSGRKPVEKEKRYLHIDPGAKYYGLPYHI